MVAVDTKKRSGPTTWEGLARLPPASDDQASPTPELDSLASLYYTQLRDRLAREIGRHIDTSSETPVFDITQLDDYASLDQFLLTRARDMAEIVLDLQAEFEKAGQPTISPSQITVGLSLDSLVGKSDRSGTLYSISAWNYSGELRIPDRVRMRQFSKGSDRFKIYLKECKKGAAERGVDEAAIYRFWNENDPDFLFFNYISGRGNLLLFEPMPGLHLGEVYRHIHSKDFNGRGPQGYVSLKDEPKFASEFIVSSLLHGHMMRLAQAIEMTPQIKAYLSAARQKNGLPDITHSEKCTTGQEMYASLDDVLTRLGLIMPPELGAECEDYCRSFKDDSLFFDFWPDNAGINLNELLHTLGWEGNADCSDLSVLEYLVSKAKDDPNRLTALRAEISTAVKIFDFEKWGKPTSMFQAITEMFYHPSISMIDQGIDKAVRVFNSVALYRAYYRKHGSFSATAELGNFLQAVDNYVQSTDHTGLRAQILTGFELDGIDSSGELDSYRFALASMIREIRYYAAAVPSLGGICEIGQYEIPQYKIKDNNTNLDQLRSLVISAYSTYETLRSLDPEVKSGRYSQIGNSLEILLDRLNIGRNTGEKEYRKEQVREWVDGCLQSLTCSDTYNGFDISDRYLSMLQYASILDSVAENGPEHENARTLARFSVFQQAMANIEMAWDNYQASDRGSSFLEFCTGRIAPGQNTGYNEQMEHFGVRFLSESSEDFLLSRYILLGEDSSMQPYTYNSRGMLKCHPFKINQERHAAIKREMSVSLDI